MDDGKLHEILQNRDCSILGKTAVGTEDGEGGEVGSVVLQADLCLQCGVCWLHVNWKTGLNNWKLHEVLQKRLQCSILGKTGADTEDADVGMEKGVR